jgi:hypothetical protein
MKSKMVLALILTLTLVACDDGQTRMALQVQGVGGQLAYGAPTLDAAKRSFFGDDTSLGGDGDGGSDGGSSDGGGSDGGAFVGNDLIDSDNPVTLLGSLPSVTGLTVTRVDDLGGGVSLRSSAIASYQRLQGWLPNGLGVLTDPLHVDMWAQSVGVQMTLAQRRYLLGDMHLDYGVGLGVSRLSAATHLQSALIDLRGRSLQSLPYAVAESRLAIGTGPAWLGSLFVFSSGATELRLGMEQEF